MEKEIILIPAGTHVWQVELKGGNIRHFSKYPSVEDIIEAFRDSYGEHVKWSEELLWEWIISIGPCEWH